MKLTVILRNDSPMIHCGDSPKYRSVQIDLIDNLARMKAFLEPFCEDGKAPVANRRGEQEPEQVKCGPITERILVDRDQCRRETIEECAGQAEQWISTYIETRPADMDEPATNVMRATGDHIRALIEPQEETS